MSDEPRRKVDWLEWVKAIGTIGSIAVAAVLYFAESNEKQRIEARARTLTQIDEFSKGETSKAKKFVDEYWVTQIPAVVRNSQAVSRQDIVNTFQAVAKADPQKYIEFSNDVASILDHLDYVSFCAQRGVCDAELVAAYYCKEVDALQSATQPTLADYDKRGIKIGANALAYFKANCDGSVPANSPVTAKAN
jgi:hypothetical protein